MAKFIYNKYNTDRSYPSVEPSWESSKRDYGYYTRQEMEYGNTYYPSYTWSVEDGYVGTGQSIYKNAGESPIIGYYYLSKASSYSMKDILYLILSSTYYDISSLKTHHYVNKKTAPLTVTKAELVDTISSAEGIYPNDGVYTNWYWYVKTSLNETATVTAPNGNETIDGEFTITWSKSDANTNVDIELSQNNGMTWKRIASNITGTSYEYDFTNETASSTCLIRIRATKDGFVSGWDTSNGVFTINHNAAPLMPTNLQPSNGKLINVYEINRLSWQHNDTGYQSNFILEWSANLENWNTITQVTTNQYRDIASNTFPEGIIYWRVKTYDDQDYESPWSDIAVFTASIPAGEPEITSSSFITKARPTFTWSQPDQVGYYIQLGSLDELLWETGEVISKNKSATCGVDLVSGEEYIWAISTLDSLGVWSVYAVQELTVNYNPPAKPTITVESNDGSVTINITNPEAEGLEPIVVRCDIYRDNAKTGEVILSDSMSYYNLTGTYTDYAPISGVNHVYHVVAVGYNEGATKSDYADGSITLRHSRLARLNGDFVDLIADPKRVEDVIYYSSQNHFAGRTKPITQFEEFEDTNLSLSFVLYEEGHLDKFKAIVKAKETILYRDNRGRKIYGTISSFSVSDDIRDFNWFNVSFVMNEVDYSEVI